MCFRSSDVKDGAQPPRHSKKTQDFDTYARDYQGKTGVKLPTSGEQLGTGLKGNNPYSNPTCSLGAAQASGSTPYG